MDLFLSKDFVVGFSKPCQIESSPSMTYLKIVHYYPDFSKLVFGFCLQDGSPVKWPNDISKLGFPMFVPNPKFGSIILEALHNHELGKITYLIGILGAVTLEVEFEGRTALHYALLAAESAEPSELLYVRVVETMVGSGYSLMNMPFEILKIHEQTKQLILKQRNIIPILKTWYPGKMRDELIQLFIDRGLTPLILSIRQKDEELSLFILEYGSSKHYLDVYPDCGTNVLHFALQRGLLSVIKVLILKKNMSLVEKDGQGRMPLLWVQPSVSKEMVSWILSLPDFEAIQKANEDTPFIKVVAKNYLEQMAVLKVRMETALLFTEDELSKQWLIHVLSLVDYSEIKFSFQNAFQLLQDPKMKEFAKECLIVL